MYRPLLLILLTLPGAFCPVGRDENPLLDQRVITTMRVIGWFKLHG